MVAEIKWIKLAADIFENRKIKQIEALPDKDAVIVIWMKLLCLAGSINDGGQIYFTKEMPYTEEMLATQFNRPQKTVQLALKVFEQFGMIEQDDTGMIWIINWEKYQNVEGMEKVREQTRQRVAKHREKKKLEEKQKCDSNVTVTQRNAIEREEEKEEEKEKEIEIERESERESAPAPKPMRQRYGIFNNVLLTDEERDTLIADFPEDYRDMIENLSEYMKSSGKIYSDHYATMRKWAREDAQKERAKAPKGRDAPKRGSAQELDDFYNRMAAWAEEDGA